MTVAKDFRENRSSMKIDQLKDVNRSSILNSKDVHRSQTSIRNRSQNLPRHRRVMSRIVYILFTTSFLYLVAGPWIGWDRNIAQQTFLTVCSTAAIVRWPLKRLRWAPHRRRTQKLQILAYCLIPWRSLSRSWGKIAAIYVPKLARPLVYGVYCKLFGVDTEEMEKPLVHYATISDFFTRKLKHTARSIDLCGSLTSPCDGTVVQCGPISDKYIKRVKGLDYCIETFLGLDPNQKSILTNSLSTQSYKTSMYQCVLYLAPGDYHRFHSPCDWVAQQRLHFSGQLLSVSPKMARWLPNLLALNERVVYFGQWEFGFFSYTAVGATNVGSIIVHNDPTLSTNNYWTPSKADYFQFSSKCELKRGEEMGMFSMGSTIVLIFEAPDNFHFTCRENDRIKLGSCLGGLDFMASASQQGCASHHASLNSLNSINSEENSDIDWNEFELDYEFVGSEKLLVT